MAEDSPREKRPVTDEDRDEIRRLHAEGKSCRAIAEAVDRSPGRVSHIAKSLGLVFDRSQTKVATAATQADNRARRAKLIADLYDLADAEVEYMKRDGYNLTEVSAGQAVDYVVERLPAQDRRALAGAIGTSLQAAVRLEQVDSDETQLPLVDQWLRSMMGREDSGS